MSTVEETLSEILSARIRKAMMEEYSHCWPARINRITGINRVDVEIVLSKRYVGGETSRYPILTDVPVQTYSASGGKAFVRLPLSLGDSGTLFIFDRAIHGWLASEGQVVPPDAPRVLSLSDACFAPGLWPFTNEEIGEFNEDLVIQNDLSTLCLTPTGQFAIQGITEELIDLIIQAVTQLIAATVTVPSTPATVPLSSVAPLTVILAKLNTLKKV